MINQRMKFEKRHVVIAVYCLFSPSFLFFCFFPWILSSSASQAATVPNDTPSQLAHIRAAVDVYLTQVKEVAKRALGPLEDTEYKALK